MMISRTGRHDLRSARRRCGTASPTNRTSTLSLHRTTLSKRTSEVGFPGMVPDQVDQPLQKDTTRDHGGGCLYRVSLPRVQKMRQVKVCVEHDWTGCTKHYIVTIYYSLKCILLVLSGNFSLAKSATSGLVQHIHFNFSFSSVGRTAYYSTFLSRKRESFFLESFYIVSPWRS